MMNVVKTISAGTLLGGSLLFTAGLGLAGAQPDTAQTPDGQVNVTLGTAGVLEDVEAQAATQIAASVCDTETAKVTSIVEAVDTDGTEQTVCTNTLGTVVISQNGPGQSESAPGITGNTPNNTGSGDETPTTVPATPGTGSAEQQGS